MAKLAEEEERDFRIMQEKMNMPNENKIETEKLMKILSPQSLTIHEAWKRENDVF
jgi:hypothetical protein